METLQPNPTMHNAHLMNYKLVERCQTNGCLHISMSNKQKHIHYSLTVLDFVDGTIIYCIRHLYW